MHPEFLQMTLHDHQRELDQRVRAAYLEKSFPDPQEENLLEGRPAPAGRYVVAEVDGDVVAAISLVSGPPWPIRSSRRRT